MTVIASIHVGADDCDKSKDRLVGGRGLGIPIFSILLSTGYVEKRFYNRSDTEINVLHKLTNIDI